jgi:predicted nucleic-acid-binding Zn-ribbon protein
MAFKRVYEDSNLQKGLYVTVLVSCSNCGAEDSLVEAGTDGNFTFEYVTGEFINSTDITDHSDCPVCGSSAWEEKQEIVKLGYPSPFQNTTIKKYLTVKEIQDKVETFLTRLRVAQENNFKLYSIDGTDESVILYKNP